MEIFLAAVIVLIIIGIIVLLIIKKKQQALDDEPVIPTTVLQQAQSSPQDIFDELTHSDKPTDADAIEKVDRLINDNRHDEAINELKRLLLSNPKNSVATLKLLQVYVLTNNLGAFDKVYQKLKESGDQETLEQAESYRLLLDDVAPEPAATTMEPISGSDSLDFNIGAPATSHHDLELTTPTSSQPSESSSDFAEFNFDEPFAETSKPSTTSSADDSAFDLDFGTTLSDDVFNLDSSSSSPSTDTPTLDMGDGLSFDTPSTTTNELDTSFDLNDFGLESTPTSTPASEPSLDDGFDLDFSLDAPSLESPNLDTPSLNTPSLDMPTLDISSSKTKEPVLTDEFALGDFDLSAPSTPKEENKPADDGLDFGDFDLGGFGTNEPKNEPKTETLVEPKADEFSLDSDDFGLSLDGLNATADSPSTNNDTLGDIDFGSDLDVLSNDLNLGTPSLDSPAVDTLASDSLSLDDLSNDFGLDNLNTPSATEEKTSSADEFALDSFELSSTPASESPKGSATTSEFDLGDLSFDTISNPKSPEPVVPAQENSPFDFDLGDLASSTPSVEKETLPNPPTDDFGFELPTAKPEVAPAISVPEPKQEPVTGFDFLTPSTPAEKPTEKPTSSFDLSELAPRPASTPAFDPSVTAGLDATGITLDLAQQYIALGEYDSAKHLLEEVVTTGNAEQSRTASNLLKRLG